MSFQSWIVVCKISVLIWNALENWSVVLLSINRFPVITTNDQMKFKELFRGQILCILKLLHNQRNLMQILPDQLLQPLILPVCLVTPVHALRTLGHLDQIPLCLYTQYTEGIKFYAQRETPPVGVVMVGGWMRVLLRSGWWWSWGWIIVIPGQVLAVSQVIHTLCSVL